MRHIARVLLGLLLSVCFAKASAADESRFRLWPFGGDRANGAELTGNSLSTNPSATATGNSAATPSQAPTSSYSADALPERRWMVQSPLARVSWPRIHMPEVSMPRPNFPRPEWLSRKSQIDDARNGWIQKSPDPARPTPLQAMQQGAQRVGQSTRTAWRKTVDALTPGEVPSAADPRVAAREKPPLWQRLRGAEQPQKPGSQTVTEMLSQERIDF